MRIRQFDIWIADLNPRIGTEAGKIRPVVIVQSNLLNNLHPSTIVCPVTTNVKPGSEILRIHLRKSKNGLKQDCDVMVDQIRSIDNRRLLKRIGVPEAKARQKLRENIKVVLDLD